MSVARLSQRSPMRQLATASSQIPNLQRRGLRLIGPTIFPDQPAAQEAQPASVGSNTSGDASKATSKARKRRAGGSKPGLITFTRPTTDALPTSPSAARTFTTTTRLLASGDASTIDFFYFPDSAVIRPSPTPAQDLASLLSRVPIISTTAAPAIAAPSALSALSSLATSTLSALGVVSPPPKVDNEVAAAAVAGTSSTAATAAATQAARRDEHNDGYEAGGEVMRATVSSATLHSIVLPISEAGESGSDGSSSSAGVDFSSAAGNVADASGAAVEDVLGTSIGKAKQAMGEAGEEAVEKARTGELGRLWDGLVEDVLGPRTGKGGKKG